MMRQIVEKVGPRKIEELNSEMNALEEIEKRLQRLESEIRARYEERLREIDIEFDKHLTRWKAARRLDQDFKQQRIREWVESTWQWKEERLWHDFDGIDRFVCPKALEIEDALHTGAGLCLETKSDLPVEEQDQTICEHDAGMEPTNIKESSFELVVYSVSVNIEKLVEAQHWDSKFWIVQNRSYFRTPLSTCSAKWRDGVFHQSRMTWLATHWKPTLICEDFDPGDGRELECVSGPPWELMKTALWTFH